eukprot:7391923-Prymnesium_polylepis.1
MSAHPTPLPHTTHHTPHTMRHAPTHHAPRAHTPHATRHTHPPHPQRPKEGQTHSAEFKAPLAAAHQPHSIAHVQDQSRAFIQVARLHAQLLLRALRQHCVEEHQLKVEGAPFLLGLVWLRQHERAPTLFGGTAERVGAASCEGVRAARRRPRAAIHRRGE